MFTYYIYVGVWNETVERDRSDAIDLLKSWSAKLVAIKMKGSPTGITYSKLPS